MTKTKIALIAALADRHRRCRMAEDGFDPNLANRYPAYANGRAAIVQLRASRPLPGPQRRAAERAEHVRHAGARSTARRTRMRAAALTVSPATGVSPHAGSHIRKQPASRRLLSHVSLSIS